MAQRTVFPLPSRGDPGEQTAPASTPETMPETTPEKTAPQDPQKGPTRPASRPRRGKARSLGLLGAAALVAVALLGARYGIARPVSLLTVTPGGFEAQLSGPGTLDADVSANVSSSLQGILTALPVERNDSVSAGQLLAEVGAEDLRAQLASAKASELAAQKAVEASQADLERARVTLANARTTLARQQELSRSGTTSKSTLDDAETAQRQAEADLAKAEAALRQSEAQEAAAVANTAAAQAQLDKSVIRAPISGVVVSRDLSLGDIVSPGTGILEIVAPESIVLTARFDESVIDQVAVGQAAALRFSAQEAEVPGTLTRIGREVDTETREFTVDITPDRLPANWAIGQRATARLSLGAEEGVLSLPSTAIARRDGLAGVWTDRDGRSEWIPVTLGRIGGEKVEILAGLKPGTQVLADPGRVFPRMRLRPEAEGDA